MTRASVQRDLIEKVAENHDVSVEVIEELLALELEFKNLHAYGARSRFRSRIGEIIDKALRDARETTER